MNYLSIVNNNEVYQSFLLGFILFCATDKILNYPSFFDALLSTWSKNTFIYLPKLDGEVTFIGGDNYTMIQDITQFINKLSSVDLSSASSNGTVI